MLSKIVGPSVVLTMSATTQTVVATTFAGPAPKVVRIATNSQPAFVNFSTNANASTGILIPANSAEHFKLENSPTFNAATTASGYLTTYSYNTATVTVLQAGTAGIISITPVA